MERDSWHCPRRGELQSLELQVGHAARPAKKKGPPGLSAVYLARTSTYKSRHSRVGSQVLMSCPIASAARRSAVPLSVPGDRPARHKGPRDPA
eukprot:scaffold5659_cov121-Isochrysis_galbana.AAC.7